MKSYALPLMLILVVCGSFAIVFAAPDDTDTTQKKNRENAVKSEHTKWLGESLREIQQIKVGMTRTQLLKVFQEEGGLSTPTQRTYVYSKCEIIKVDVTFQVQDKNAEHPKDKITKITKPYLASSILD